MSKLRIPLSFKEKDLNRSVYSLDQNKVMTMMQGLNIPVKFEIMKPKDEFTIDYRSMIQSMPMDGQQLNDWKLRTMIFKSNLANYYSWMDNNARLSSSEIENKRHHTMSAKSIADSSPNDIYSQAVAEKLYPTLFAKKRNTAYWTNFCRFMLSIHYAKRDGASLQTGVDAEFEPKVGVQANSLLDMLEFPVSFVVSGTESGVYATAEVGKSFNADYLLCYLDAVRNYLVNNQLTSVPYMANVPNFDVDAEDNLFVDGYRPFILSMSLKTIDRYLKWLRMCDDGVDLVGTLVSAYIAGAIDVSQYQDMLQWFSTLRFGGMFLAQYERDMLNNLLRSVNMQDVNITVDENGNFSINQFRLANRRQLLKDRFGISGGRWKNLLRTVWGSDTNASMDVPELVHTSSYYVSAKSLMSTANTYDGENGSSLGQLGGVFNTNDLGAKKTTVYAEDHCIMFAIVSLVPDVVYCNGLGKGLDIISFDDEYYPQLDALGFEDVPRFKYNALPYYDPTTGNQNNQTESDYIKVVGKNIAFIDLISNVNRCHGAFTKDMYFETWVLKRRFETDMRDYVDVPYPAEINYPIVPSSDITSYVNPFEYQYPFTVQSASDCNFVFQIAFDIRAVRSKGKYFMPTLGK